VQAVLGPEEGLVHDEGLVGVHVAVQDGPAQTGYFERKGILRVWKRGSVKYVECITTTSSRPCSRGTGRVQDPRSQEEVQDGPRSGQQLLLGAPVRPPSRLSKQQGLPYEQRADEVDGGGAAEGPGSDSDNSDHHGGDADSEVSEAEADWHTVARRAGGQDGATEGGAAVEAGEEGATADVLAWAALLGDDGSDDSDDDELGDTGLAGTVPGAPLAQGYTQALSQEVPPNPFAQPMAAEVGQKRALLSCGDAAAGSFAPPTSQEMAIKLPRTDWDNPPPAGHSQSSSYVPVANLPPSFLRRAPAVTTQPPTSRTPALQGHLGQPKPLLDRSGGPRLTPRLLPLSAIRLQRYSGGASTGSSGRRRRLSSTHRVIFSPLTIPILPGSASQSSATAVLKSSPMPASSPHATSTIAVACGESQPWELLVTEEELVALMEELESRGVLQKVHASSGGVSGAKPLSPVDQVVSETAQEVTFCYYPVDEDCADTGVAFGASVPASPLLAPSAEESHAAAALISGPGLTQFLLQGRSACKVSVHRVEAAPGPGEAGEYWDDEAYQQEACRWMAQLESAGVIPGAAASPSVGAGQLRSLQTIGEDRLVGVQTEAARATTPWPLKVLGGGNGGAGESFDFYMTGGDWDPDVTPMDTGEAVGVPAADEDELWADGEGSRDTAVSCSDLLGAPFSAAMQVSSPLAEAGEEGDHPEQRCRDGGGLPWRAQSPRLTFQFQPPPQGPPSAPTLKQQAGAVTTAPSSRTKGVDSAVRRSASSPYTTPYTPSKVSTPGRYLYCPLWQTGICPPCSAIPRSRGGDAAVDNTQTSGDNSQSTVLQPSAPQYPSDVLPPSRLGSSAEQGFGMRQVRNPKHCATFLHQLRQARCVSFELVFRPLPSHWLARYSSYSSGTGQSVNSWAPYISWSCGKVGTVTCTPADLLLDPSLALDAGQPRRKFGSPHVLVGAALCFGDSYGYYLPLPTPLPLPPNPYDEHTAPAGARLSAGLADQLSPTCRERIAAYVGFGSLLCKCPALALHLRSAVARTVPLEVASGVACAAGVANPLFLLSRRWSYSARSALLQAWRTGASTEWRLFSDFMRRPGLTKVAVHAKSKLVALRERDVVVEGPLADPSVAVALLTQSEAPELEVAEQRHPAVDLQIPQLMNAVSLRRSNNNCTELDLHAGQKTACFRAVAVFRATAHLEAQLDRVGTLPLYRNIETTLLHSAGDAEYGGIAVDSAYFGELRQNLILRQELIGSYFEALFGADFNVASPADVAQLRRRLEEESSRAAAGVCGPDAALPVEALQQAVQRHPVMQLVSEHRSHARLLPLCSAVLSNRCFNRVRACFNTLGTETGRVILTQPPLQQVSCYDSEYLLYPYV
jgi:hypothetical protein